MVQSADLMFSCLSVISLTVQVDPSSSHYLNWALGPSTLHLTTELIRKFSQYYEDSSVQTSKVFAHLSLTITLLSRMQGLTLPFLYALHSWLVSECHASVTDASD